MRTVPLATTCRPATGYGQRLMRSLFNYYYYAFFFYQSSVEQVRVLRRVIPRVSRLSPPGPTGEQKNSR